MVCEKICGEVVGLFIYILTYTVTGLPFCDDRSSSSSSCLRDGWYGVEGRSVVNNRGWGSISSFLFLARAPLVSNSIFSLSPLWNFLSGSSISHIYWKFNLPTIYKAFSQCYIMVALGSLTNCIHADLSLRITDNQPFLLFTNFVHRREKILWGTLTHSVQNAPYRMVSLTSNH